MNLILFDLINALVQSPSITFGISLFKGVGERIVVFLDVVDKSGGDLLVRERILQKAFF